MSQSSSLTHFRDESIDEPVFSHSVQRGKHRQVSFISVNAKKYFIKLYYFCFLLIYKIIVHKNFNLILIFLATSFLKIRFCRYKAMYRRVTTAPHQSVNVIFLLNVENFYQKFHFSVYLFIRIIRFLFIYTFDLFTLFTLFIRIIYFVKVDLIKLFVS